MGHRARYPGHLHDRQRRHRWSENLQRRHALSERHSLRRRNARPVSLALAWHPGPGDVNQLAAHIDYFPTLAELAGAKIPSEVAAKLEGRSLVPLLQDHAAPWADRILFTHVGRWERGQAAQAKYRNGSVRSPRFNMVSAGSGARRWELFDLRSDPGEAVNVIEKQPDVARELEAAYDQWWNSILPGLENENLDGPAVNPFHELYWKQFRTKWFSRGRVAGSRSESQRGIYQAPRGDRVSQPVLTGRRQRASVRPQWLSPLKGTNIDHVHGVWSCTKSFTSTVLGLLIDDGKCSLDTRARTSCPR